MEALYDSKLNLLSFKIDNLLSKEPIYIDTLNMNGCLIGKDVFMIKLDFAPYFVHGGADGVWIKGVKKQMVLRFLD